MARVTAPAPRRPVSRPVVGVTAFLHRVDDTFDAQICGNRTPEAVAAVADCLPLIVAGLPGAASTEELFGLLDGLVLTGARPNVHPSQPRRDRGARALRAATTWCCR